MHAGLAGDALVEGRAQEDRVKRRVEEEEDCLHAHHCAVGKSAVGGLSGLQQRGVGGGGGRLHIDWVTGCGCPPGETP